METQTINIFRSPTTLEDSFDIILENEGYTIGNIIKYAQRYGKKNGFDKSDLLKVIHYSIIALSIHENKFPNRAIEYENSNT